MLIFCEIVSGLMTNTCATFSSSSERKEPRFMFPLGTKSAFLLYLGLFFNINLMFTIPENEILQCRCSNNGNNVINIIVRLIVYQPICMFSWSSCRITLMRSRQSTGKKRILSIPLLYIYIYILSIPFAYEELLNRENKTVFWVSQKKSLENL